MKENVTVYIAGDSIAESYPKEKYPRMGWGQVLQNYFNDNICVENYAIGGRSSKSFIEEGRLKNISDNIKKGDYLFIQFGHNDEKTDQRHTEPYTTYKFYLNEYVKTALEKGAYPVLFTSAVRRIFDEKGFLVNTHGDYPEAVREFAEEKNVPLIDLCRKTTELYNKIGEHGSVKMHMIFDNRAYENYAEGCFDNTHFCEYGARVLADFIAEGIRELDLKLKKYLAEI